MPVYKWCHVGVASIISRKHFQFLTLMVKNLRIYLRCVFPSNNINCIHWYLQIIVFASQDVLTREECKDGYLLLRCLRAYIEFDLYAAFEVHTTHTLVAGREALHIFNTLIEVNFLHALVLMPMLIVCRCTPRQSKDPGRSGTFQKII